ncbi:unnamed protein product, partial [Discosporangium mesarthrocarpum]
NGDRPYTRGGEDDGNRAFMDMNVVAADEKVPGRMEKTAMLTSSDDDDKITLLCDSGANVHDSDTTVPNITELHGSKVHLRKQGATASSGNGDYRAQDRRRWREDLFPRTHERAR